jgi:hypothetical protein|tara:strand:- start:413 stop:637 length:225 start_codon:yes stop_codon:yes gene_type:complete
MNFIKKVIKKIMDLKTIRQGLTKQTESKQDELELSPKEIDFLLQTIATSQFEGKDVQIVYETAVKLQKLLNTKN